MLNVLYSEHDWPNSCFIKSCEVNGALQSFTRHDKSSYTKTVNVLTQPFFSIRLGITSKIIDTHTLILANPAQNIFWNLKLVAMQQNRRIRWGTEQGKPLSFLDWKFFLQNSPIIKGKGRCQANLLSLSRQKVKPWFQILCHYNGERKGERHLDSKLWLIEKQGINQVSLSKKIWNHELKHVNSQKNEIKHEFAIQAFYHWSNYQLISRIR